VQLQWITSGEEGFLEAFAAQQKKRDRRNRLLLAVAAVLVAAIAGPAFLYLRGSTGNQELRFRIPIFGLSPDNMAFSADGRTMALVIQPDSGGPSSLYVRSVNGLAYRQLSGTTDATQPFWSPDSRFIAFIAAGKIKAVEVTGGAPKELCDVTDVSGGTW